MGLELTTLRSRPELRSRVGLSHAGAKKIHIFKFLFKDFIYLFERGSRTGKGVEGQGKADSLLSRAPDMGFDPRTLGS